VQIFNPTARLPFAEFIVLMSLLTSVVALSIDMMLPALPIIAQDLSVADTNDTQLVISAVFLGMGLGQLAFGPICDSFGRKNSLYIGMGIFILGTLLCLTATSFNMMLVGRLLQGVGASGPRVATLALTRDVYEGRNMARVMSLSMMVFLAVPMIAPLLGELVLYISDWRGIFVSLLAYALLLLIWFAVRQPETLSIEDRQVFTYDNIKNGFATVCSNRVALGYTISIGVVSGPLLMYLSTAQAILQDQYALGLQFGVYFAAIAFFMGIASFVNSKLVIKYGMRLLSKYALLIIVVASCLYTIPVLVSSGHPPLWSYMTYLTCSLCCLSILFSNMNALAMEPLGKNAGTGAAVIGSLSTIISVPVGIFIGSFYEQSVLPVVLGFAICAAIALALKSWANKGTELGN